MKSLLNRTMYKNNKNKGLYALIYCPNIKMGESTYFTKIKVGRTGKSFSQRFRGYTGEDKITSEVAVHVLPLESQGREKKYGFTAEEAWVKKQLKAYCCKNQEDFRAKDDKEEFFYVKTHKSHLFLQAILDAFEIVKDRNRREQLKAKEERAYYQKNIDLLHSRENSVPAAKAVEEPESTISAAASSLWRFARSSFSSTPLKY